MFLFWWRWLARYRIGVSHVWLSSPCLRLPTRTCAASSRVVFTVHIPSQRTCYLERSDCELFLLFLGALTPLCFSFSPSPFPFHVPQRVHPALPHCTGRAFRPRNVGLEWVFTMIYRLSRAPHQCAHHLLRSHWKPVPFAHLLPPLALTHSSPPSSEPTGSDHQHCFAWMIFVAILTLQIKSDLAKNAYLMLTAWLFDLCLRCVMWRVMLL